MISFGDELWLLPFSIQLQYIGAHFTLGKYCDAKFLLKQAAQNNQFWLSYSGAVLLIQQFHHIAFRKVTLLVTVVVMHDRAHTACALH